MVLVKPTLAVDQVARSIHSVRGHRVMLDADLADLYGVTTGALNRAVRRNPSRFPRDFMFELTPAELDAFKSQIVTSSSTRSDLRSQTGISSLWGGRRHPTLAFTEQGVAMLSSVLRSERAVQVNIEIMRAFVRLRQWVLSVEDLTTRLDTLEAKYDRQFKVVFDAIRELMTPPEPPQKRIGFRAVKQ